MVLVLVLVMLLGVLMNHIGIYDKDILGSSVESFDGINDKKACGFIAGKYHE